MCWVVNWINKKFNLAMSRILLYGSFTIIIAIGYWYYFQGENVPDSLLPIIAFLLAVMSFGYGEKAKEDGDFGAVNSKVRKDKNPKIFQIALYFNYIMTAGFLILAIYLFSS